MIKHPVRLWIVVILLGFAFDFLFWGKPVGINFALFATLCLLGGLYLLLADGLRPMSKSLLLVISFLIFAVITFLRQEPLTVYLAYTFAFFSMGVLAVTYLGGRWTQYSLADYVMKSLQLAVSMLTRPFEFFNRVRKEQAEQGNLKIRVSAWPVVRGLLIAFPVVVFFAYLLASADLIFSRKLAEFMRLFEPSKFVEYITRLVIIVVWAYLLAGVFLHAASQSKDEKLLGEDKPLLKPFLGFTETVIVLGSVTILFFLFVIIQFRYFFGGDVNIGIEGYTYSEYARRGFNELVIVAFFSLLMILGLSAITQRESKMQRRTYSGLSVAIVALVLVILVSAYQRLTLAILWHGFSRLRLYPRVFLVWVGLLFVTVVILEIFHKERYFAFAAVLASLGFALSLALLNVDASIARYNVLRASQGKHFNVFHLASLSTDAVPVLVDEYLHSPLPAETHQGIGAALLCFTYSDVLSSDLPGDWRSFSYSRWRANKALQAVQAYLQGYKVNDKRSPVKVRTPDNELYECPELSNSRGAPSAYY